MRNKITNIIVGLCMAVGGFAIGIAVTSQAAPGVTYGGGDTTEVCFANHSYFFNNGTETYQGSNVWLLRGPNWNPPNGYIETNQGFNNGGC